MPVEDGRGKENLRCKGDRMCIYGIININGLISRALNVLTTIDLSQEMPSRVSEVTNVENIGRANRQLGTRTVAGFVKV